MRELLPNVVIPMSALALLGVAVAIVAEGGLAFLGLSVDQVRRLREEFSIYTVNSARVNIASFNANNIDYFIDALKKVL